MSADRVDAVRRILEAAVAGGSTNPGAPWETGHLSEEAEWIPPREVHGVAPIYIDPADGLRAAGLDPAAG